jgi:hypothetical protein
MSNIAWAVTFRSTRQGVQLVNTLHYAESKGTGGGDNASADEVRDNVAAGLKDLYRAMLPTDATLDEIIVRSEVRDPAQDVPEQSQLTVGQAGTRTIVTNQLPKSICVLATIRTNAPVRGGIGRVFLPAPVEASWLDAGSWSSGITTNSGSPWKQFMDAAIATQSWGTINQHDLPLVVYSRTRHRRGDANYWFAASGYVIRSQPHWLRSRATAP